jgi:hypothetical protein
MHGAFQHHAPLFLMPGSAMATTQLPSLSDDSALGRKAGSGIRGIAFTQARANQSRKQRSGQKVEVLCLRRRTADTRWSAILLEHLGHYWRYSVAGRSP